MIYWWAPGGCLHKDSTSNFITTSYREVIDMNGDGRPDLVEAPYKDNPPPTYPYLWRVYINTGSSFDSNFPETPQHSDALPYFPAAFDHIAQVYNNPDEPDSGFVLQQLADFNGDGLPDILAMRGSAYACSPPDHPFDPVACLDVYFNTGEGFSTLFVTSKLKDASGIRVWNHGKTSVDMFDANGDGLPDYVYLEGNSWVVNYNRGDRLEDWSEDLETWPSDNEVPRESHSGNEKVDLIDVNGDGLLDLLKADNAGAWSVRLNSNLTPTNLLTFIRNTYTGLSQFRYKPSTVYDNTGGDGVSDLPFVVWVVDAIRRTDGLCDPGEIADPFDPETNPCIASGNELLELRLQGRSLR